MRRSTPGMRPASAAMRRNGTTMTWQESSATASAAYLPRSNPSTPTASPRIGNASTCSLPEPSTHTVFRNPERTTYSASKSSPARHRVSPGCRRLTANSTSVIPPGVCNATPSSFANSASPTTDPAWDTEFVQGAQLPSPAGCMLTTLASYIALSLGQLIGMPFIRWPAARRTDPVAQDVRHEAEFPGFVEAVLGAGREAGVRVLLARGISEHDRAQLRTHSLHPCQRFEIPAPLWGQAEQQDADGAALDGRKRFVHAAAFAVQIDARNPAHHRDEALPDFGRAFHDENACRIVGQCVFVWLIHWTQSGEARGAALSADADSMGRDSPIRFRTIPSRRGQWRVGAGPWRPRARRLGLFLGAG